LTIDLTSKCLCKITLMLTEMFNGDHGERDLVTTVWCVSFHKPLRTTRASFFPPLQVPPLANSDRTSHNATPPRNGGTHRPTFGVDLAEQMARDNCEVPPIMPKCCQAIETYGLQSQGIYRLSGTTSKVAKLKERLDRGM
jgi:hypothetical protein